MTATNGARTNGTGGSLYKATAVVLCNSISINPETLSKAPPAGGGFKLTVAPGVIVIDLRTKVAAAIEKIQATMPQLIAAADETTKVLMGQKDGSLEEIQTRTRTLTAALASAKTEVINAYKAGEVVNLTINHGENYGLELVFKTSAVSDPERVNYRLGVSLVDVSVSDESDYVTFTFNQGASKISDGFFGRMVYDRPSNTLVGVTVHEARNPVRLVANVVYWANFEEVAGWSVKIQGWRDNEDPTTKMHQRTRPSMRPMHFGPVKEDEGELFNPVISKGTLVAIAEAPATPAPTPAPAEPATPTSPLAQVSEQVEAPPEAAEKPAAKKGKRTKKAETSDEATA